jgi:prepilin-type N-terminal cleavage/methylation domain-containing protein
LIQNSKFPPTGDHPKGDKILRPSRISLWLNNYRKGFTLVELIIAIFIMSVVMIGVMTVAVSILNAYQKEKAMKTVKESVDFAISSIAKDVRMGKIESTSSPTTLTDKIEITRNQTLSKVCYQRNQQTLDICEKACASCVTGDYKSLADLSGTGMIFDENTSGFYYQQTTSVSPFVRGWVEINLNIIPTGGISNIDMHTDAINIQTTISSRDYGWE